MRVKAQGELIFFMCPACGELHGLNHTWQFNGNYERPTFTPSVLVTKEWGALYEKQICHSFVTDGQIQFLGDCTHALAGQTVDLPVIE